MSVDKLLDDLESLVIGAKRLPFTSNCIISEQDLMQAINSLRRELPKTIANAREILQEKEEILEEAKKKADDIVVQAKDYAFKVAGEDEIVASARQKAKEVSDTAMENIKAQEAGFQQYSGEVCDYLLTHLNEVSKYVIGLNQDIEKITQDIHQVKQDLQQPAISKTAEEEMQDVSDKNTK